MTEEIHVVPINDSLPHFTDGSPCLCLPTEKQVEGGTVIVHNSWDGREAWEDVKLAG